MLVRGLLVVAILAVVCWTTLGQDIGLPPIVLPQTPPVPAKHTARKVTDPLEPSVRLREALAEPPALIPVSQLEPPAIPATLPERIPEKPPEPARPLEPTLVRPESPLVPPTPVRSPTEPFPGLAPSPNPIQIPPPPSFPPVTRQPQPLPPPPTIVPVQVPAPAPAPTPIPVVVAPSAKPIAVSLRGRVVGELGSSIALIEVEGRMHTVVRESVIAVTGGSLQVTDLTASDVVITLLPSRETLRLR